MKKATLMVTILMLVSGYCMAQGSGASGLGENNLDRKSDSHFHLLGLSSERRIPQHGSPLSGHRVGTYGQRPLFNTSFWREREKNRSAVERHEGGWGRSHHGLGHALYQEMVGE